MNTNTKIIGNTNLMFRAMGSILREDDVISRREDGIFDLHFRLRDFASSYITLGNPE